MNHYWERIDRNLGVITHDEQEKLRKSCVAIAGCGGMGGQVAATLARIGVGHIKIADNQNFDISNLNRQFGAKISTIGCNKADETYKQIKEIVSDVEIEVFTGGVNAENVYDFVEGADLICDEIEFYELPARIMLHQAARSAGVKIFNCNVVGFGTRIFFFTPDSMKIEEFLEADERTIVEGPVIWRMVERFAPDLPKDISKEKLESWVFKEHKVPIFGGTPLLSSGILLDRLCLQLIGYSTRPWITEIPPMPAYGYFDAGGFKAYIKKGKWW
jgi:molybdopterin/thiamine biosynthesis adenylyltransferase